MWNLFKPSIVLIIFLLSAQITNAQNWNSLSVNDQELIRKDVGEKISDFGKALQILAMSRDTEDIKYWRELVSSYFSKDAHVVVSWLGKEGIRYDTFPLKIYLDRVERLRAKYKVVKFDFIKVSVSKLEKFDDGNGGTCYKGVCKYVQQFRATKKGSIKFNTSEIPTYLFDVIETTKKRVEFTVCQMKTIEGIKWVWRFGNITVEETTPN